MRYLLIAVLMLLPLTASAKAQLSQREYQLLIKAFESLEAEQYQAAHVQLMAAKDQMSSDYARALVFHNLGQVELQSERYGKALGHLRSAYELKALPEEQQVGLIRTLAQLNCMEEKWKACIAHLEHWMGEMGKTSPQMIKGDDHLLLAQAYSQRENWAKVIKSVSAAIASRKVAPENWYQLKVVTHIRLKQWRAAIREQKRMIGHYADRPDHWRQLVALHIQVKDRKSALADQRMAFERGLLQKAQDYRLLAQMLLQAEIPFYAGEVVQQGLKRGVLKQSKKNLQLLSRCWIQAREHERAVVALAQLNRLAPNEKSLTQMAHMQIELQDWNAAQKTLLKALKGGQGKQARLQLLLGITRIKLKHYDKARHALAAAASDQQLKAAVEGWMQYLNQIWPQQTLATTS